MHARGLVSSKFESARPYHLWTRIPTSKIGDDGLAARLRCEPRPWSSVPALALSLFATIRCRLLANGSGLQRPSRITRQFSWGRDEATHQSITNRGCWRGRDFQTACRFGALLIFTNLYNHPFPTLFDLLI